MRCDTPPLREDAEIQGRDLLKKTFSYAHYVLLLEHFVSLVQETMGGNLISIVLYGSVARGEAGPESDVDLLLILRNASSVYHERLQPMLPLLRQLRRQSDWPHLRAEGLVPEINVLILSQEEADQNRLLYLDMIEDARILVDRDNFFRNRLQKLQKRLQELGARKIRQNGSWYWDLIPHLKLEERILL